MKKISLEECARADYHIRFLEAVEIQQKTANPAFSSIGFPKKQDMLLLVNECSTHYITKDKKDIFTKSGDVVYVPRGSEYTVKCIKEAPAPQRSSTLQINFLLFDEDFAPFILSDEIVRYTPQTSMLREMFENAMYIGRNASSSPSAQKQILFGILGALAEKNIQSESDPMIEKGVSYLELHYRENPSIAQLAQLCHITPEYFRKLFKKHTGQTPIQYRNALRLQKAKQYLLYSDMPVAQISDELSFAGASHFIEAFKKAYGCSPLSFRNDFLKGLSK